MAITTYTSPDAIRAILGVSPKEIKDATLELPYLEQQFLLELLAVDGDGGAVMALYSASAAKAADVRTADEQRFIDLVNVLAGYSVARQTLTGLSLAAPQKITSNKNAIERFDAQNFDKVRTGVFASYAAILRRLKALLLKMEPSVLIASGQDRVFAAGAGIASDPITGV